MNEKTSDPVIFVVSDSLGETAELVARAAGSQFDGGHVNIRRVPYVAEVSDIEAIFQEAVKYNSVITYTVVIEELREAISRLSVEHDIPCVDLLGPTMEAVTRVTGMQPKMATGLLRKLDDEYFRKVDAIEFAVKYDDGKDARGFKKADIVLIGVSRTSKTPVCMYLGHKKIKAANLPLVPEVAPPEELFEIPPKKIIGLTIRSQLLNDIRSERLKVLGLGSGADYANPNRIIEELEYAESIFRKVGCAVIDVTNRAVEETASKVLEIYYKGEKNV
ncbi:pyruvate, water dikinase regulatory protein [Candidatus Formimonas warabiya]|uniref:Putative pyruvate, phosphate dikinase regulatory protein n=1 Tax=Formimonas warabiya TaxID=1761012 RepID=A0A3G1KY10_FORW1|nr:pyruvate, water dikinase regulatory protein [Candidatus Formimonas warabiya]ATW27331.1 phosphoenolpyruvate synthase regulatory protein [Candidatus Formimonas warabiya]